MMNPVTVGGFAKVKVLRTVTRTMRCRRRRETALRQIPFVARHGRGNWTVSLPLGIEKCR